MSIFPPREELPDRRPIRSLPEDDDGPVTFYVRLPSGNVITWPMVRHSVYRDRWVGQHTFAPVPDCYEVIGWAPLAETVPPPPVSEATVICPGAEP